MLAAHVAAIVLFSSFVLPMGQAVVSHAAPTAPAKPNEPRIRIVPNTPTSGASSIVTAMFESARIVAATVAWDDTLVEVSRNSSSSRHGVEAILRAEAEEVAEGRMPELLWFTAIGEAPTGFSEWKPTPSPESRKTSGPGSVRSQLPASAHKYRPSQLHAKGSTKATKTTADGQNWVPNKANIDARVTNGKWVVTHEHIWDQFNYGKPSPQNIMAGWGFESTVLVRNDGIHGTREKSKCIGGDEHNDYPGAFNGNALGLTRPELVRFESWSSQDWPSVGFYVDWWSSDDPCSYKQYDYGIGNPRSLQPNLDTGYGIKVTLQVQQGAMPAGVGGAYMQTVQDNCSPATYSSLCMDLRIDTGNPNIPRVIPFLGEPRNAFFPGKLSYSREIGRAHV